MIDVVLRVGKSPIAACRLVADIVTHMDKENRSDERLVNKLCEAIHGLTCSVERLCNQADADDTRLLRKSLQRVQSLARRLRRLAKVTAQLDESTER